jgi:uncharacterized OsmC-like protein
MPEAARDVTAGPANPAATHHTLRCRTVAGGSFQNLNYVRNLPPIPVEERLGLPTDEVTVTPSETLLAALGSCLAARIRADAVTGSIHVQSLALDMEVDVERSPLWGTLGARLVGFEAIRVAVHLEADAPPEALRALIAHALLWSPVANTIHNAVHLDVALAETALA